MASLLDSQGCGLPLPLGHHGNRQRGMSPGSAILQATSFALELGTAPHQEDEGEKTGGKRGRRGQF
jgi:hypothetical protein